MPSLGDLVVRIVGDNSDFNAKVDSAEAKFVALGKSLQNIGKKLTTFVTLPILAIGAAAIKSSADMEMQQAAFETMLGSADKAKKLLTDLKDLAARTPFSTSDLADASKTLLSFGFSAERLLPTIRQLGDVAGGNAQRFGQLSLAFAQVQATGRLMGQDLLQMVNAGFNPLQEISEKTGVSLAELKKQMEKGAISADMIADAFASATSEGGRFFGGMERASKTLAGQWSTLMDTLAELGRSFADILLPPIKNAIAQVTKIAEGFTKLDEGTKKLILGVLGVAAVVGPLMLGIGKLIPVVLALNAAVAANPMAALAIAVGLVVTALAGYAVAKGIAKKATDASTTAVKDNTKALDENAQAERRRWLEREIALQKEGIAEIKREKSDQRWIAVIEDDIALLEAELATLKPLNVETKTLTTDQQFLANTQKELAANLAKVNEQWKLALTTGEEVDVASERRKVLLAAIGKLIENNFTVEGTGIQSLLAQYGTALEAYANQEEALEEIATVVAELEEQRQADAEAEKVRKEEALEDIVRERAAEAVAAAEAATNSAKRLTFYKRQHDAAGQAVIAINEERLAFIDAGVAAEEANAWATGEIKRVRDEEHAAEMARIKTERDERIRDATEIASRLADLARVLANSRIAEIQRETDALDAAHEKQLGAIDTALQAALKAAGLAEETKVEQLKKALAAAQKAGDTKKALELQAELNKEQKREQILAEFAQRRADAEEEYAAKRRALVRAEAVATKNLALFDIAVNTARAIVAALASPGGIPGAILAAIAAVTGIAQAAAVAAKPLPALAEGGVVMPRPGGMQATIAEAGQAEAVIPLDRLDEMLSRWPTAGGDGETGDIHLQVVLDSRPIMEKIFPATRNRLVLIDAGAVV